MFNFLLKYPVIIALGVVGLMSGLLSIIREVLLIYNPSRFQQRSLFWSCMWISCILSLFLCCYGLYQRNDEVQAQLEKQKPRLVLTLNTLVVGDTGANRAELFVNLSVRNHGTPSAAYNWKISISSLGIRQMSATIIPNDFAITNQSGQRILFFGRDVHRIYDVTTEPLPQGKITGGWIRFSFVGFNRVQIRDAQKTISCLDVNDQEVSITFTHLAQPNVSQWSPESGADPVITKQWD